MFNSLVDMLEQNCSDDKGIFFVLNEHEDKFVSYKTLYNTALYILGALQKRGIAKGDKVILQIDDLETFIYSLWGCVLGGIVAIPLAVGMTDEQISRLFRVYSLFDHAYILTTHDTLAEINKFQENANPGASKIEVENIMLFSDLVNENNTIGNVRHPEPDDVALVMFSSGSTGMPKGVLTTHRNILVTNEDLVIKFNIDTSDVSLHWMPLTHMVGIVFCHLFPIMTITDQVLIDKKLYFRDPNIWLDKICQHRATILLTANFGMKYLMSKIRKDKKWNLSHIKIVTLGGEAQSAELIDSFVKSLDKFGMRRAMISPVYGVTEAMVVACVESDKEINIYNLDRLSLSIKSRVKENLTEGITFVGLGSPPNRCNVRICDNDNLILEDGQVGNIQVSGPNVFPGYYHSLDNSEESFSKDGWYKTGDVGFILNGEVVITGRAKEMIIINMVNYYLFDIERIVEESADSLNGNIAVCGIQNSITKEDELIVFVSTSEGEFAEKAQMIRLNVKAKIGLNIKAILPIDDIPRSGLGKINRFKLISMYHNGELELKNSQVDQTNEEIGKSIREIIIKAIGISELNDTDNIFDLGAQSLTAFQIAVEIEEKFNISFSVRTLYENPIVKSINESVIDALNKT